MLHAIGNHGNRRVLQMVTFSCVLFILATDTKVYIYTLKIYSRIFF